MTIINDGLRFSGLGEDGPFRSQFRVAMQCDPPALRSRQVGP